jgi:NTE family protein
MKDGYGLVLEGGGGKGSYEIGVYKALLELEIPIIAITGTSVGALNGALIAQGGFQEAYDLWYNMAPGLVINTDTKVYEELINFNIDIKGIKKYYHYVKDLITQGGLDIEPLKALIPKIYR